MYSVLPIVVPRVPLTSLKPADLSSPDRIPDAALRDALWRATRDLSGKEFEKALLDFSRKDQVFKGIRRVRVREGLKVIPVRDKLGVDYKGTKGQAHARCDAWKLQNVKSKCWVIWMCGGGRNEFN